MSEPKKGQYNKFKSAAILPRAKSCQNGCNISTSFYWMLDAVSAEKLAKRNKLAAETRRLQPTWWLYFWVTKTIRILKSTKLVTQGTELLVWLPTLCWIRSFIRSWARTFAWSVVNFWRKLCVEVRAKVRFWQETTGWGISCWFLIET